MRKLAHNCRLASPPRWALWGGWRLLTLLSCLVIATPLAAEIKDDVMAASNRAKVTVEKALADEDGGLLASIFTDDALVISSRGATIQGRSTIRASATLAFLTMGSGRLEVSRRYLTVVDSTGYETGRYVFRRSGDADPDAAYSGQYTVIWEIEDGVWKVARAIGL